MKELIIKKCLKCGAIVKVLKDCECPDCGINCCGEAMKELKTNSTDGAIEKHKPTYTVDNNKLIVNVAHVMEEDHYIEWICLVTDNKEEYVYFKPNDNPTATFDKVSKGTIYSYCNKHGLWKTEIE